MNTVDPMAMMMTIRMGIRYGFTYRYSLLAEPLKSRIAELEGLLADAVKRRDELVLALDAEQKQVEKLKEKLAACERQSKPATPTATAKRKGK